MRFLPRGSPITDSRCPQSEEVDRGSRYNWRNTKSDICAQKHARYSSTSPSSSNSKHPSRYAATSTASTTTCCAYSSTADSLPRQTTSSSAITWIGGNSRSKRYVFSLLTRLNTPKTFSFFVATTSVQVSIESTDSMMNVSCPLALLPFLLSLMLRAYHLSSRD